MLECGVDVQGRATWARGWGGHRAGGTLEGMCPHLSGAEDFRLQSGEEVYVWGAGHRWREPEARGVWVRLPFAVRTQVTERHELLRGQESMGKGEPGKEMQTGTHAAERPRRREGCVSKRRNVVGSILLLLVNCYHFGRIFTSFGSCLSEIHNMCSLH